MKPQDQRREIWRIEVRDLLVRLVIAVHSCLLIPEPAARAETLHCPNANIVVHSQNSVDAEAACEGGADAIKFLDDQGLKTTGPIELLIVDKLPAADGFSASDHSISGLYSPAERRAYLLSFSEFAKQVAFLDLPIDRALYKSLATHEVAHVIVAANFDVPKPRIEAQEYIVYVTMFATMHPRYREYLLEKFPGPGFETEMQINTTIYLYDPLRFGVQAYRHFLKPGNGQAFLHKILTGRALIRGNGP